MDIGPSTSKCFITNDFSKVKAHKTSILVDDKSHFGLKRSGISSSTKRPRIADDYNSSFSDNTSTGSTSSSRRKTDDGIFRRVTNTVSGLFSNSWSEWITGSSPSVTQDERQDSLFNSSRDVSSDTMNPGIKKENKLLNQLYPEEGIAESVEKDDNVGLTTSQPVSIENSWPPLKSVISSFKEDQSFIASTPSLSPYLAKRGNDDLLAEPVPSKHNTPEFQRELLPPREDSVNLLKHSFSEVPNENYSSQINGSISSFPSSRKKLRENIEDEMNIENIHSTESKKRTLTQSQMFTEESEESSESMKRKRPRFSISTYGSPFHNKTTEDEPPSFSVFYPGKIMYGGASNHQRKRNRIIPRKICPRTPAVVSTNDDDHSDGGLSSAARRILDCIDKISTPLSDSKRAFQFCSPRDFSFNTSTFVSDFHKNRPSVKANTHNKDTPPAAKLLTPSKVKITKNFSSLFSSKTSETETVIKEASTEKEIKKSNPECNKNISSSVNTVSQKSSESSVPKKSLESFSTKEKASKQDPFKIYGNCQNPVNSDKVSKSSSICSSTAVDCSSISSRVDIHVSDSLNNRNADSLTNSQIKENHKAESFSHDNYKYKFSFPSVLSDQSILQKLPKNSVEFKFSHPINEAELPSKEVSVADVRESGYIIKKNKWNCDTCLLQNDDSNLKCIACEAPKPDRSNSKSISATSSQNFGNAFKKPVGSWECKSCLLQNPCENEICVACTAAKPKNVSKILDTSSDEKQLGFNGNWGETFKRPEGSWDCPQCLLQNKSSVDKCASCEAPKSLNSNSGNNKSVKPSLSNWGDAFKPSEGSWVCESCLVHNTSNCSNCLCCKAAKPKKENDNKAKSCKELASSDSSDIKNFPVNQDNLKVNENSWICLECLTTNKNLEIKCLNCKCSRPIPPNDLPTNNKEIFACSFPAQFKKGKDEWECETCCVRNKNSEQKCQSCATPRASLSHSDIVSEALTGNFKFDANSKPKIIEISSRFKSDVSETTKENSSEFSFGIINPDVTKAENSNNTDLDCKKPKDLKSGFSFGVNSSNGGKSNNLTFGTNVSSKDEKYSKINFDVNPGSIKEATSDFSFGIPVSKPETSSFNFGVGSPLSKDISDNIQIQNAVKTSNDGNSSISNTLLVQTSNVEPSKSITFDITGMKSNKDNTVDKSLTSPLTVPIENKTSSSSQLTSSITNSSSSKLIFGIPNTSAPFNASDAISITAPTSTTSFSFSKSSVQNKIEKPSENKASSQESKEYKPVFQFGSSSTTLNSGAKFEFPKTDYSNAKKPNDFFSQGFPKVNPTSFNFFGNTNSTPLVDNKTSLPSFGDSKTSSSIFVFGNTEAKPQNTGFSFGNTETNKSNSKVPVFGGLGSSSSQSIKFGQQEANKNKPSGTASSSSFTYIDALQNPFNASTSGGPQRQRITKRAHRRLK